MYSMYASKVAVLVDGKLELTLRTVAITYLFNTSRNALQELPPTSRTAPSAMVSLDDSSIQIHKHNTE